MIVKITENSKNKDPVEFVLVAETEGDLEFMGALDLHGMHLFRKEIFRTKKPGKDCFECTSAILSVDPHCEQRAYLPRCRQSKGA